MAERPLSNPLADRRFINSAEAKRFFNDSLRGWHSLSWFPTGFDSVEQIVDSEFEAYADTGITPAMVRDAASCCKWCTRARIAGGRLTFSGGNSGKAGGSISLLRKLHARKPLPDMELTLAWHDVFTPDNWEKNSHCHRKLLPIFSHSKSRVPWARSADGPNVLSFQRGLLTMPENTFLQSYGGHSSNWDAERRQLLAQQRPWLERNASGQLFFRGNAMGYRHFLNISRRGTVDFSDEMRFHFYPRHLAVGPPPPHVSSADHCRQRYLVHLPGVWPSHSNKLKHLLACGAVVVMPQNNWYECEYPGIQTRAFAAAC